ncbi:hypothetical protein PLICRDRAFT_55663 [Plicaturopsis crispa FD-325 SS-3]|nr:hypothetical protein PLICRDRAFT_55663 [Plicaturopsis crispa FD-325 SS-3]
MSVSLSPSSALGFNRPLTQLVKRSLTISNPHGQPVAFKVKTTAPKLYCVRPNSGRIEPGESIEVSVMLQAMKEEPPLSAKCKDKFLIQSTIITSEKETLPLHDIWNTTDTNEETKVHQQKLRVVYLPPEGQTVEEEDETQANQSSFLPDNRFDTVREHPATNGDAHDILSHERPSSPPVDFIAAQEESHEEPTVGVVNVNVHTPPPPTPPPVVAEPAPNPVNEELLLKYRAAQSEIERLRSLLAAVPDTSTLPAESTVAGTELRRRNRALSDDGSTVAETEAGTYLEDAAMQSPEGVPLQVVVIIALGVFITTYLFF